MLDWLDPDYDFDKAKKERERDLRAAEAFDRRERADEAKRGKWFKWLAP
jgi:hypothetical protein